MLHATGLLLHTRWLLVHAIWLMLHGQLGRHGFCCTPEVRFASRFLAAGLQLRLACLLLLELRQLPHRRYRVADFYTGQFPMRPSLTGGSPSCVLSN